MAPSRNIVDFFKPYVKAKRRVVVDDDDAFDNIVVTDKRTPIPSGTSGATIPLSNPGEVTHDDKKTPVPEPQLSSSKLIRQHVDVAVPIAVSSSSSLSSLSANSLDAPVQAEPRRIMRQLSPLSSRASKSPSPELSQPGNAALILPPVDSKPPDVNASFMSNSSLSAPPVSSQSSSRRVVRNGQMAVTNSDSDSMDQDDDPLDEIEELIRRKRMSMKSDISKSSSKGEINQTGSRDLRSSTRKSPSQPRKPGPPPRKRYKFDLASLAKQSKTEAAWNQKQKEYAYLEVIEEDSQPELQSRDGKSGLDRISDQLRGEDGDVQEKNEIVRAMKRMDALQEDLQYHFFRPTAHQTREDFPIACLDEHQKWAKIMKDEACREQAFTTGFVAVMARMLPLPDDIVQWMFQDLLYETQPELCMAYISVLQVHFENMPANLEFLRERLLAFAGRTDFSSGVEAKVPGSPESPNTRRNPTSLSAARWSSMLVSKVSERLPITEQRSWLHVLVLILLDRSVQDDIATKTEVQQALSVLMDSISPERFDSSCLNAGITVLKSINNPILLHRLLSSLPSTSSSLHAFKRRLALAYTMKSEDYLTDPLDRISITSTVTAHLRRSVKFRIRESTDFAALGARIGILDIAIGAGFSDFAFLPPSLKHATDSASPEQAGTSVPGNKRPPPGEEERAFNEAIDALVAELRLVAGNIRDAGAAHMQRTECKGMLEKLSYRLEYAARTRPKPKRSIFRGRGLGGGGGNATVTSFLEKRKEDEVVV